MGSTAAVDVARMAVCVALPSAPVCRVTGDGWYPPGLRAWASSPAVHTMA